MKLNRVIFRPLAASVVACLGGLACYGQCVPTWEPLGHLTDVDSEPRALAVIQRPAGPALIVTGTFAGTRDGPAPGNAMFDGTSWHAIAPVPGLPSGSTNLVGAGAFAYTWASSCSAGTTSWFKTDGLTWTEQPTAPFVVRSLVGLNGELYALAGTCSGVPRDIYRWNGEAWLPVAPTLVSGSYSCLTEFNGELVVGGGSMVGPGGGAPLSVAALRGGGLVGLGALKGSTNSLAVQGNKLYAAGGIDPIKAPLFIKAFFWDGISWTPLPFPAEFTVNRNTIVLDSAGSDLVFSGEVPGQNGELPFISAVVLRDGVWTTLFWAENSSFGHPVAFGSHGTTYLLLNDNGSPTAPHVWTANPTHAALFPDSSFRPACFSTYQGKVVAAEYISDLKVSRVWRYDGTNRSQVGPDVPANLSSADSFPCLQEFDGQLFLIESISAQPNCYRWDGVAWTPTTGLEGGARRLFRIGSDLWAIGKQSPSSNACRWDGAAWVPEPNSPLSNRAVYGWDGQRVLISTILPSKFAVYDGRTLSVVPDPPGYTGSGSFTAPTFYRGELFIGGAYGTEGTFRLHDDAWEKISPTFSDSFLVHRDTLYRNGNQRWTGSAWVADTSNPFAPEYWYGQSRFISLNGDLYAGGDELSVGDVFAAGAIVSTCHCKADITGDGAQDLADFIAFFNAWDQSQSPADLNFDGTLDLSDFFFFFEYWDRGCGG